MKTTYICAEDGFVKDFEDDDSERELGDRVTFDGRFYAVTGIEPIFRDGEWTRTAFLCSRIF
jgi:hypothetical protein